MVNQEKEWHHLHARVDIPLWRRLRKMFPDYGAIKAIVNQALEDYCDKVEDLDMYLEKCAMMLEQRKKTGKSPLY